MTGPSDGTLWDRQPRPAGDQTDHPVPQNRDWHWPAGHEPRELRDELRGRDRLRKGGRNGDK